MGYQIDSKRIERVIRHEKKSLIGRKNEKRGASSSAIKRG